jgi:hypothetical protein
MKETEIAGALEKPEAIESSVVKVEEYSKVSN